MGKPSFNSVAGLQLAGVLVLLCVPLACRANSQVVTWGSTNSFGLGNVPANLTNVVALAAGDSHSVALKADGKVVVWGSNGAGQTNVPAAASNIVAVAAAWQHTVALKSNGTVVAWGTGGATVPAGLTNLITISAGDYFNLGLKANGTVVAWGDAGSATNVPAGLSNVVAIAAGGNFSVALKGDGTIVTWGSSPSTTGLTNVAAIAAGEFPLVSLKANRTVAGSGATVYSNVVSVAAGRYHSQVLKDDGTVTAWNGAPTPTPPATLTNVVAVASGQNHCLALIGDGPPVLTTPMLNRSVLPGSDVPFYISAVGARPLAYQWQANGTNIPAATNVTLLLTNVVPDDSGNYSVIVTNNFGSVTSSVAVLTVADFSAALNTTGLVWTTTGNSQWFIETNVTHDGVAALQSGVLTNFQSTTLQTTVTGPGTLTFWWKVSGPGDAPLRFFGGNSQQAGITGNVDWQQKTFYLGAGPQVLKWIFQKGGNASVPPYSGWVDEVSFTPGATAPIFTTLPVSQSQASGFSATLSGAATGTPPLSYQWQLDHSDIPGATGGAYTIANLQSSNAGNYSLVVSNIAGITNTDATLELGQIAAWGDNGYGQITVPPGMTNVLAIACDKIHNLALKSDGTVVAWGNNDGGRATVPAGLSNVIAVAGSAGAEYSLVLKADGTVTAWGNNSHGQTNVPSDLTNVVGIAAGWYHGMALKTDGAVVAWGYNNDGEANVPTDLSNVVAIAGGSFHSLAATADGTTVGWGQNGVQTIIPTGLSNVVAVAGGLFFSSAVRSDGTVVSWGDNSSGQTNVPSDLTNVVGLAAGWYHGLAFKADGTIAACDTNSTVPLGLTNIISVGAGLFHNLALQGISPPVLHALVTQPIMTPNGFQVSIPTQSGKIYRLEYKDSPADADWIPLSLVAGNGGVKTLTDATTTGMQRVYRIRQW
ncbi:MAG: hypothetical protein HOP33_19595 [Verrucomicrobia bacterium]|nr:hypothetical protein [Verrucomicrobiota bacterium]